MFQGGICMRDIIGARDHERTVEQQNTFKQQHYLEDQNLKHLVIHTKNLYYSKSVKFYYNNCFF